MLLESVINKVKISANAPPGLEKFGSFSDIFIFGINVLIVFGAGYAIFTIALSFYSLITSGGNPDKVKRYTSGVMWGIIALLIVLATYAIKSVILKGIGADVLDNPENY